MKLTFIGDICLARLIFSKFKLSNYQIVENEVISLLSASDHVVANLESPICTEAQTDGDHLSFRGTPEMLAQFKYIDFFSLSNNHINDCGELGMIETIDSLNAFEIGHNGLFEDEYIPIILNEGGQKIAIFTCTDMMNIPFAENCNLKTLHIDDAKLNELISSYKKEGFFIILYAHVGILFSRYVNPVIRTLLHEKIDFGADVLITAHSHCVGGMEFYKGKPIFHSLGDFVMDGGSYRRRQSVILNIEIVKGIFKSYTILPVKTNSELVTILAQGKVEKRILNSWNSVTMKLDRHSIDYPQFFKKQYKRELFQHTLSTFKFLLRTKGLIGMIAMVIKRYEEVFRMGKWIAKDRSKDRRDDEAILKDRKKFSEKELYKT